MSALKARTVDGGGRTLLTALLLSAPGPLVTAFAALTSGSATQIADCIRRLAELAATFVSWLVYRRVHGGAACTDARRARLERGANITVACAMLLSGAALMAVGVARFFVPTQSGRPISGLVIALLGLIVNSLFFFRYRGLARAQDDAILDGQRRLYMAKAAVDLCVSAALLAVVIAPDSPATMYVDAVGSIAVSVYLLINGGAMLRRELSR